MHAAQIFSCAAFCFLLAIPPPTAAPVPPATAAPAGNKYKPPEARTATAVNNVPTAPTAAL